MQPKRIAAITFRVFTLAGVIGGGLLFAENVIPSFANVPTGWVTDRYAPASFTNVGTYHSMDSVLGIGISSADGLGSRPGFEAAFYNTQGKNIAVTGASGDHASVYLYIPQAWSDPHSGNIRTDEWMVQNGGAGFGILGFSNYGAGGPRFEAWDNTSRWHDLAAPVLYDQWNLLDITYTAGTYDFAHNVYNSSTFTYAVNGTVYATLNGAAAGPGAITAVIMQAYNFNGDGRAETALEGFSGPAPYESNYTAYYANTPEPGTWGMMLLSLGGMGVVMRKRRSGN